VRALLRRAAARHLGSRSGAAHRHRASRVTLDGNPVKLTSLEYRLLAYLAHHKGARGFAHRAGGASYEQDFDRDSNQSSLRRPAAQKLEADLIQTVRGLGYCLDDPAASSENSA